MGYAVVEVVVTEGDVVVVAQEGTTVDKGGRTYRAWQVRDGDRVCYTAIGHEAMESCIGWVRDLEGRAHAKVVS